MMKDILHLDGRGAGSRGTHEESPPIYKGLLEYPSMRNHSVLNRNDTPYWENENLEDSGDRIELTG